MGIFSTDTPSNLSQGTLAAREVAAGAAKRTRARRWRAPKVPWVAGTAWTSLVVSASRRPLPAGALVILDTLALSPAVPENEVISVARRHLPGARGAHSDVIAIGASRQCLVTGRGLRKMAAL
jgi:hypothetical protein